MSARRKLLAAVGVAAAFVLAASGAMAAISSPSVAGASPAAAGAKAAPAAPPFDPATVPGTQVVWATAPAGATQGTLELWQKAGGKWKRTFGVGAWFGKQGISPNASEQTSYTPEGTFTLTEAFGRLKNPGTRLPYLHVDSSKTWWWVSDVNSPLYNQKYQCAKADCPFNTDASENLYDAGPVYDYAVVMDYNRDPVVAGKGSAFFIHVTNNKPTAGCVSIPDTQMKQLVKTLKPANKPVIITKAA